jgi:hypothetical protein
VALSLLEMYEDTEQVIAHVELGLEQRLSQYVFSDRKSIIILMWNLPEMIRSRDTHAGRRARESGSGSNLCFIVATLLKGRASLG